LGRTVADLAWVRIGATRFPGSGRTMGSLGRDSCQSGSAVGRTDGREGGRLGSWEHDVDGMVGREQGSGQTGGVLRDNVRA
jgi:hypothetical protein